VQRLHLHRVGQELRDRVGVAADRADRGQALLVARSNVLVTAASRAGLPVMYTVGAESDVNLEGS